MQSARFPLQALTVPITLLITLVSSMFEMRWIPLPAWTAFPLSSTWQSLITLDAVSAKLLVVLINPMTHPGKVSAAALSPPSSLIRLLVKIELLVDTVRLNRFIRVENTRKGSTVTLNAFLAATGLMFVAGSRFPENALYF